VLNADTSPWEATSLAIAATHFFPSAGASCQCRLNFDPLRPAIEGQYSAVANTSGNRKITNVW
jgi:hypothetical protein